MNKGILIVSILVLASMFFIQIALGFHPDFKEFSDSFVSIEEYRNALPAYGEYSTGR
ncbi:MAG: hypothetical protein K6L80_07920 [Agarilytica sp.]